MHNFVFLLFTLFANIAFGQNNLQLKRVVKTDSFNIEVFVSEKRNLQYKHNDSLYYYWFKSQKIFRTQGESEGEIIHGVFRKFYLSGQLAEKGYLHFGLKHGKWRTWYTNGNLKSVQKYRRGKRHGTLVQYSQAGEIVLIEEYRKDKLKSKRLKKQDDKDEGKQDDNEEESDGKITKKLREIFGKEAKEN